MNILYDSYTLFMCVFIIFMGMCVCFYEIMRTKCVQKPMEAKRALDLLELELAMVVSYCIGGGNSTQVLCKRSKYSRLLSSSP